MIANECEQVRVLSEEFSKKRCEPVLAIFNASAGSIYGIGIDNISTQFNRQMQTKLEQKQIINPQSFIAEKETGFLLRKY